MPQVPHYDAPTVTAQTNPTPYDPVRADASDFGGQAGQAMQQFGGAAQQTSDMLAQHAMQMQQLNNEAATKQAYIDFSQQMRTTLFDPKTGYYALQGKDAVDAYQPTIDKLQQLRQTVVDNLANDQQRRMFQDVALRRTEVELDGMARHAAGQQRAWQDQTSDGVVQDNLNDAAAYYNDPKRFGLAVITGQQEISNHAAQVGMPPEQEQAKRAAFTSAAWKARVERMAINDPVGAQNIYQQNMEQMTGTDQSLVERQLKPLVDAVQTRNIATTIMSGKPTANGADLVSAVSNQESGGQSGLTSPAGAKGVMQVMPSTARQVAAELNMPYDEDKLLNDADYNKALGTQYLKDMLSRYGGNQTLALAAYNAGPGRVDQWLSTIGDPRSGALSDTDWAAKIPLPETRDYVAAINAKVPPQPGQAPTDADVKAHLADWLHQADALGLDPVRSDLVKSHILTTAHQVEAGQQAADQANRQTLLGIAMGAQPGQPKPTNLDQLLANQGARTAWTAAPPETQQSILGVLDRNAKAAEPPLNNASEGLYYQLLGNAATDPESFRAEKLTDYADQLPWSLMQELMNKQVAMQSKNMRDAQAEIDLRHAMSVMQNTLRGVGIVPPTNAQAQTTGGKKMANTFEQFTGRLGKALETFQATNKKYPTDDEISSIGNSLLVQGLQSGSGWIGGTSWIGGDKSVRAFQVDDQKNFYVPVPKTEKPALQTAFQQVYGRAPTDGELQDFYTRTQLAAKK